MKVYYLSFGTGALNHYAFTTPEKAQAFYLKLRETMIRESKLDYPPSIMPLWIKSINEGYWQIADYSKAGWTHEGFQYIAPHDLGGLLEQPTIWEVELDPTEHCWV